MIIKSAGTEGSILHARDVMGKAPKSFVCFIPTSSLVYTILSKMFKDASLINSSASIYETIGHSGTYNDLDNDRKCREYLGCLDKESQQELKVKLLSNLSENSTIPKPNEDYYSYMDRRAQRNPRTSKDVYRPKSCTRKKKPSARDIRRDKEKYCLTDDVQRAHNTKQMSKKKSSTEDDTPEDIVLNDALSDYDICLELNDTDLFDDLEHDTVVQKMKHRQDRIRLPGQMGEWIEIKVCGITKTVTCNCQGFCTSHICFHTAFFDVLQFEWYPDGKITTVGERWDQIRTNVMKNIVETCIECSAC
jgi:hypothetical protein